MNTFITFATDEPTATLTAGLLFVAVIQIYLLRRKLAFDLAWPRRRETLEWSVSRNDLYTQAKFRFEGAFGPVGEMKGALSMADLCKIKYGGSLYNDIVVILSHWDTLAIAIEAGIADGDIAFRHYSWTVTQHVTVFRAWIDNRRQRHNPAAYEQLLALDREWSARLKPRQGSPIKALSA